jgi:hypothetical protein
MRLRNPHYGYAIQILRQSTDKPLKLQGVRYDKFSVDEIAILSTSRHDLP